MELYSKIKILLGTILIWINLGQHSILNESNALRRTMNKTDKEVQAFISRAYHEDQDKLSKELEQKSWPNEVVKYVHFKWIDIYAQKELENNSDQMEFFGNLFGMSLIGLGVLVYAVFFFWSTDAVLQDQQAQSRIKWISVLLISIGAGVIGKEKIFNRESPSNPKRKRGKFNPFKN